MSLNDLYTKFYIVILHRLLLKSQGNMTLAASHYEGSEQKSLSEEDLGRLKSYLAKFHPLCLREKLLLT